ncbi:MAG: carbohydrate ABC transporter permease [Thermomicrobiales bacterium]
MQTTGTADLYPSTQSARGLRRFRLTHLQKRNLWGVAFALPAIFLFALFSIYPIARTFYLSFFDYSVVDPPVPAGLDNYRQILGDPRFHASLFNSFRYVLFTYVPVWGLALLLALALNTRIKARAIFRTIYFVPVVMSWVVVSVIWKLIFHRNGLLNVLALGPLGIPPQNWLTDQNIAALAITIMSVWKEVGFFMVIFLAGLQAISPDYIEAAKVDGSNVWQVFRFITLPLLQPTILFATVIGLITGLQVFIPQFVMTNGGPVNATLVVTLDIYETAFVFLKMGKAAAMSVVLFFIIAIITLIQFRLYRGRAYQ